jgi:hypothetical protein
MNSQLKQFRVPLMVGLTSLGLSLGGVLAWSLWSDSSVTASPVRFSTGLVDAKALVEESIWQRSTAGYGDPSSQPCGPVTLAEEGSPDIVTVLCPDATSVDSDGLVSLVTMPGDSFDYLMPITAYVKGQNLAAGFTVTIDDPQVEAIVATWDSDTQQWIDGELAVEFYIADPVAPNVPLVPQPPQRLAQIGEILTLPKLVPEAAPDVQAASSYILVARATVLSDYAWANDFSGSDRGSWTIGNISFVLTQVRGGGAQ